MKRVYKYALSVFLLGFVMAVFQLGTTYHLRRDLERAGFNEVGDWDGITGSDYSTVHPPCKPTRVEQKSWKNATAIKEVFEETYKPNVDMVVALCTENFEKVLHVAAELRVRSLYVYSKCGQSPTLNVKYAKKFDDLNIHFKVLPNVGREGHAYITHALRKDLDPNGWTIFVQAQIHSTLNQAMLSLTAAHEHDAQKDGTTMINMFRTTPPKGPNQGLCFSRADVKKAKFCTPIHLGGINSFIGPRSMQRYQTHHGSQSYVDVMGKEVFYRGEFIAKNTLFKKIDREKLHQIKSGLEVANAPLEGYWLEVFWTGVLGGADNCRCEGMPTNKLPPGTENIAKGKPTKQSKTVGILEAQNAVDGGQTRGSFASARPQEDEDVSWWEVDLETIAAIEKVTIHRPPFNRDVPFSNTTLEILDSNETVVVSEDINTDGLELVMNMNFTIGRFVRIKKSGWKTSPKTLNIAQVEVAGYPYTWGKGKRHLTFPIPPRAYFPGRWIENWGLGTDIE